MVFLLVLIKKIMGIWVNCSLTDELFTTLCEEDIAGTWNFHLGVSDSDLFFSVVPSNTELFNILWSFTVYRGLPQSTFVCHLPTSF